jgi:hypothetical protein
VHQDVPSGRGTARLELAALEGSAADLVDRALALAAAAVAPSWKSVAPAAPAKVTVLDPALARADLAQAPPRRCAACAGPPAPPRRRASSCSASRSPCSRAPGSPRAGPRASSAPRRSSPPGIAASPSRARPAVLGDLGLPAALAGAAADLGLSAAAGAPEPGRCALVLTAEAMLHGGGHGVWAPFAAHADAALERRGLTRYRVGAPVAPRRRSRRRAARDRERRRARLRHRLRARRRGRRRDPAVPADRARRLRRRRPLGARGRAARARSQRRRAQPRRRARTWDGDAAAAAARRGRAVEVRRLRALSIDPYTGEASLELLLAVDHRGGAARPFTGGAVYLDLVAALARARRSAQLIARGPYLGPAAALIEDAELV